MFSVLTAMFQDSQHNVFSLPFPLAIETTRSAGLSQDKDQDTMTFPSVSWGKHHIACDFNLGIYQYVTTKGINSRRSFLYINDNISTDMYLLSINMCMISYHFIHWYLHGFFSSREEAEPLSLLCCSLFELCCQYCTHRNPLN